MTHRSLLVVAFAAATALPCGAPAQTVDRCLPVCTDAISLGTGVYMRCNLDYRLCPQITNGTQNWLAQRQFCRSYAPTRAAETTGVVTAWDMLSLSSEGERYEIANWLINLSPFPTVPLGAIVSLRRDSGFNCGGWRWDSNNAGPTPVPASWWNWGPTCWAYNGNDLYASAGPQRVWVKENGVWSARYIMQLAQSNGMEPGFACEQLPSSSP